MASLGFRTPQFSEDFAWLPAWLQHPQLQSSSPAAASQEFKGLVSNGKDVEILSIEEEGRNYYNNCRLFLSGEDTKSQHSITPGNVLNLCLRLSSDSDSQYSQSQLLRRTQRLDDSSKALPLKQVETSGGPGEACQLKMDHDGVGVISPLTSAGIPMENADSQSPTNKDGWRQYKGKIGQNVSCRMHYSPLSSVPTTVENAGPQSATNYEDRGCQYEETSNARHIKNSDISDAVELSISASEALVIHKFMMTGSSSDALEKRAILEAALHVKQARVAASEDAFGCPSDEVDEIDCLSDLDDSIMEDAFLDVGLSFSACDDKHLRELDVSQVEDTPVLENHRLDKGSEHIQLLLQQKNADDDSDLGLYPSDGKCLGDHILPQAAEKFSQGSSVAKKETIRYIIQLQTDSGADGWEVGHWRKEGDDSAKLKQNSPKSIPTFFVGKTSFLSESADVTLDENSFVQKHGMRSNISSQSSKKGDASAKLKQNSPKIIPKFFVCKTSSLSESADIAPDEKSFVQKHEMRSNIGSQSSIPFEALHGKADDGILISQEVGSSDLSLVDPLCSIVPCSISLENTGSPLARNDRKVDAENCFSPNTDIGMESFQKTLHQKIECVYMDSQAVTVITGKCSDTPLRRKVASLRTYSTLLPNCDATLEMEGPCHNRWCSSGHVRNLHSSHQQMGCIRSSDQRNSKGVLPFKSVFESTVGRDNEENQDITIMRNLVAETTGQKRSHDQPTKDRVEMKVKPSVQRRSPLILNRRTRCHPQTSELFAHNINGGKNSELAVAQENIINLCPSKNVGKVQLKLKNSVSALNPVRKRVCFSEVEFNLDQNKDIRKQQTLHRNGQMKDVKRLIFHGLEFLLTGFSHKKEKEIVKLIQIYGGMILLDIPSAPNSRSKQVSRSNLHDLPVVICSKKLQTTKFLYGCAVNALILKLKWLTDSVAAGSVVSPDKYMIISNQAYLKCTRIGKSVRCDHQKRIFDRVGIVLHGKHRFCSKLTSIVKHASGQVFKTLQSLVESLDSEKISMGAIVAENENWALRHLRHCASERKIPMMPASWIAKSLHLGKLLPFGEEENTPSAIEVPKCTTFMDWSQEI
ncbi:unnamed protein product [Dovyalis caffra]|uniref:BRCT domain-containing protein n=1 Tax=Dovyalis caffra TaxID=77055 RepID=A0AAV1RM35_9ROSI|nr:unnamed protein product [Dovyalis caffra]